MIPNTPDTKAHKYNRNGSPLVIAEIAGNKQTASTAIAGRKNTVVNKPTASAGTDQPDLFMFITKGTPNVSGQRPRANQFPFSTEPSSRDSLQSDCSALETSIPQRFAALDTNAAAKATISVATAITIRAGTGKCQTT